MLTSYQERLVVEQREVLQAHAPDRIELLEVRLSDMKELDTTISIE